MSSEHARFLRQYARGVRRAAEREPDDQRRAEMEGVAVRLLAAASELGGVRLEDYARVEEVAERLGIHPESVRRLMRGGQLVARRLGNMWLMDREELERVAGEDRWAGRERWWEPEPVVKRSRKLGEASEKTVRGWMRVGPRGGE